MMDAERKARDLDGGSGNPRPTGNEIPGEEAATSSRTSTTSHPDAAREHRRNNDARSREGEERQGSTESRDGGAAGDRTSGRRHSGTTSPGESEEARPNGDVSNGKADTSMRDSKSGGGSGDGGGGGYFDDDDIDFDINDLEDVLV